MENIGDIIVFVVVALVMIGKVIKGMVEQSSQRSDSRRSSSPAEWTDWEDWQPVASPPSPPKPKTMPPARPPAMPADVAEVIRTLSEPPPAPPPEAALGTLDQAPTGVSGATQTESRERFGSSETFPASSELTPSQLVGGSLATAFPEATRKVPASKAGARRLVGLKIQGRKSLRQAVLMREILAQPRAFDI